MIEIIPSINVETFDEMQRRVRDVENLVDWIHIDVEDGTFTKNTNLHNPIEIASLDTRLNIEIHLMVADVERRIDEWLIAPFQRIIFHIETTHDPDFVISKIKDAEKQVGVAIGRDTSWTRLVPYCGKDVDMFHVLAVTPGLAGQEFDHTSLDKIKHLRTSCPSGIIEVDGGIKKGIASACVLAGANIVVSASAIFGPSRLGRAEADPADIKAAIDELKVDVEIK